MTLFFLILAGYWCDGISIWIEIYDYSTTMSNCYTRYILTCQKKKWVTYKLVKWKNDECLPVRCICTEVTILGILVV